MAEKFMFCVLRLLLLPGFSFIRKVQIGTTRECGNYAETFVFFKLNWFDCK